MRNIRYVQFKTTQGIGYGCFVIDWERHNGSLNYEIGMSFCSPKDSFSKKLARTIAINRLNSDKCLMGRALSASTGFITQEDFEIILNQIVQRTELVPNEQYYVPNWAKKSLFNRTFELGLRQHQVWKKLSVMGSQKISSDLVELINTDYSSLSALQKHMLG